MSAAAPSVDRFDGDRAFAELRRQVELGPRPAGSPTLRRLAERLRRALPNGRFESVPGHPGLRNVVGSLPGEDAGDRRRRPLRHEGHPRLRRRQRRRRRHGGRARARTRPAPERAPAGAPALRFVLFDGEEATDDDRPFARDRPARLEGVRAAPPRQGPRPDPARLRRRQGHAHHARGELGSGALERAAAAARSVGAGAAFPPGTGGAITDDHTPFLAQGVPAIDLIEWPYVCWHERCDDMSAVSERSLDQTGETVLELVRTLSRP